ncbi:S8 family peptidase [Polluticoccus soli]|uniref:S8 family peptidase n=1 Tax=Polluticoccus soli TaxID=3034150 RepID=UPI0023E1B310|nr:S8 family peptidase [Flavipsychrobacter sp. JY13-12]
MKAYLTLLCLIASFIVEAKDRYIVYFGSKAGGGENAISLSPAALQQRKAQGIGFDIYDVAVNEADIEKLRSAGVQVVRTSRWLNAALVETDMLPTALRQVSDNIVRVQQAPIQAAAINKFEVAGTQQVDLEMANKTTALIDYGAATMQNHLYNIDYLHNKGYTGKGVTLAFFDAGYNGFDTIPYFEALRQRNGLKATYDFWTNSANVYHGSGHGTFCSSKIIANIPGSFVGLAPDVDVLLAVTDHPVTETHDDEFNYIAALEWADSIGAQVVSASISYKKFDAPTADYIYSDMDGKTTIVTNGVRVAAAKGMIIVNAAGNSGFICAPCDADSILCVGGADSLRNYDQISSFGPSFDGRVKPDVAALTRNGYSISDNGQIYTSFYGGTSSATPQIAGIAACLKQAYPYASNIDIIEAIKKSAHQYATPDSLMGYGVPDARKADSILYERFLAVPQTVKSNTGFRVYPNPAKDEFIIEGIENIQTVQVTSIVGQTIFRKDIKTPVAVIRLNGAAPGVYFVTVVTEDNTTSTHRLVLE